MKIRVVVDTNCARNEKSLSELFGNRKELIGISELGEIIVPEIVIEEILEQKRICFEGTRDNLLRNAVLCHSEIDTQKISEMDFNNIEQSLRLDQTIPYVTIGISDKANAFDYAQHLAIKHFAPFEKTLTKD